MKEHGWITVEIPDEFCSTGELDFDESNSICEIDTEVCKYCGLLRDSPKPVFRKTCSGVWKDDDKKWYWCIRGDWATVMSKEEVK